MTELQIGEEIWATMDGVGCFRAVVRQRVSWSCYSVEIVAGPLDGATVICRFVEDETEETL